VKRFVLAFVIMEAMRQSWSDDRLDDLNKRVDAGFVRVDEQFARVDEQFARVDEQFARVDERFVRLEERIERLGEKLDAKIDRKIDASTAELYRAMQMGFNDVNSRFDAMQQTMIRVGAGLIGVLIASSAGLIATQL
jgi:chromosome segregation ATPase